MREALRFAAQQFADFLRRCEGEPPYLAGVTIAFDDYADAWRFRAHFSPRVTVVQFHAPPEIVETPILDWSIAARYVLDEAGRARRLDIGQCEMELRSLYSRVYENHLLELQLEPRREIIQRRREIGAPASAVATAQRDYDQFAEHLYRHHREPPRFIGVDYGRGLGQTVVWESAPAGVDTDGPFNELRQRVVRETEQAFGLASNQIAEPPTALTVENVRRAVEMLRRNDIPATDWRQFYDGVAYDHAGMRRGGGPEAEKKAEKLLLDWLAPDQRHDYLKDKSFIVVGSDTKKRYRINYGRQMNVHELDGKLRPVRGLCFLPEGGLVTEDIMLAQKIALETSEGAALKVANRFPVGGAGGSVAGVWIDEAAVFAFPASNPPPPPPASAPAGT